MKIIGENLHIISPSTREAIVNRDEDFVKKLIEREANANVDWIDLNIGPAKRNFEGTMKWLIDIAQGLTDIPLSLDTTNLAEIENGLKSAKKPENFILNSTNADPEKLDAMTSLAAEYKSNLIALTMNKELGIPKMADERLALAFEIVEAAEAKGISNEKLFFDPLILPVCVEQSQAVEALNAIRMFKESFEPKVQTTIGLSNVSNGSPKELRGLINRVFFVLAYGCGLDSAIADAFDCELLRINRVLETHQTEKSYDKLIIDLASAMRDFAELEDVSYDKNDIEQMRIYKTAEILLNKKVYSHSWLEI